MSAAVDMAESWDGTGPDPEPRDIPDPLDEWDHPPSGQAPARPTIRIQVGRQSLSRMIGECIEALGADPNLYQRNGDLVRIVREPDRIIPATERVPHDPHAHLDIRRGANIVLRPGTPRIVSAVPVLLERADIAANWEAWKSKRGPKGKDEGDGARGEWAPADPHPTVIRQVATRQDWPCIRPIRGILESPCLAPSGRVILAPGYDEETGHVLIPSVDVGPIVDLPTQEHARAALRYLWTSIACDFPFRGLGEPDHENDPDRVLQYAKALEVPDAFVGVAVLLSIFARLAIEGAVPAGLFEAAGQGSGKSLQVHTIAMVSTGRPAGVATFPTRDGKPDEAELEKILMGYALIAARLVCFDNIRGMLAGGTIERVLTAVDTIEGRVLGSNDQRSLPWYAVLMFTGNNMTCSDDVAQRTLLSRLESGREDPRARPRDTFKFSDLLGEVRRRRAKLVRAVLVILRAYTAAKAAGKDVPDPGTRGSFEAWSRLIPGALMFAGGPNILKAFPEGGRGGDEESEAHAALMRLWRAEWDGQRGSMILDAMFRGEKDHDPNAPPDPQLVDARAAVRALTKTREGLVPGAQAFGMKLRALRGKVRDGLRIEIGEDKSAKVATFRVVSVP